jgi:hypothetical protein
VWYFIGFTQLHNMDEAYQNAVDKQSDFLLHKKAHELRSMPESGTFNSVIDGETVQGVWSHFISDRDVHQIVYRLERTTIKIFVSQYFSGVKVLPNGQVTLLSTQELGYYEL